MIIISDDANNVIIIISGAKIFVFKVISLMLGTKRIVPFFKLFWNNDRKIDDSSFATLDGSTVKQFRFNATD